MSSMPIEIISIGDEILSGNVMDTNTTYIADKLWLSGLEVTYHTGVRDDPQKIKEVLLNSAKRSQVVIVTGGLGPTADDLTIEVAAKAFRKRLKVDEKYLRYLKGLFERWRRPFRANNEKQAYVPEGAKTFQNRVGTAPGICVKFKKSHFYFLPGVPREMKQLFEDFILPEILSLRKDPIHFESKMLKCFGAAEGELDDALKDLYSSRLEIENARIGFRAHFPETFIKLSAWHRDPARVKKILRDAEGKVRERVGSYVYGEGDDTLESVVGHLLTQRRKTLSTAESCTGGMIADRITNIPGSSTYFKNGIVSYSDEAKISVLGVSSDIIKKHGAVSPACVIEMAQGVRRISKSDYGIAVSGIAGPSGGTAEKPVGTVHIALASQKGTQEKRYLLPRRRDFFKVLVSSIALDCIRRELLPK